MAQNKTDILHKRHEEEVMKLMVEDLADIQKEKIGKCNSIEELLLKINQLYFIEEHKEEDNSRERSVQDPGKFEGKSLEHSNYNSFEETCLSSIEFNETHCCSISDRNLDDTKIEITTILGKVELDSEITNDTVESLKGNVMNILKKQEIFKHITWLYNTN